MTPRSEQPRRVLLLATTTGYQTRMFAEAAATLGVEVVYATDRCDQLDDPWRDGAIPVRFHEEWRSVDGVLKALESRPVNGVLVVGDRPSVMAAYITRLLGLPGHSPESAGIARDKRLSRARLKAAGLPVPEFLTVPSATDPSTLLSRVTFPAVIKPTVLSGSRGVIRADDALSLVTAFGRVQRLLASNEIRELRDPESDVIQIESYIPGAEYALEGILEHGAFHTLAIFDKPDPMDGPFFEESIYVTPSRVNVGIQRQIQDMVERAARAVGLHHGPVHAECRVNSRGVYVLEVAARPIGGLCARTLRFVKPGEPSIGLEQLLLRHAVGEPVGGWTREAEASAVMMIPIPRSGVFRGATGVDEAKAVAGVDDVLVTAKPDQQLLALPEGASYLGFIFAHAPTPEAAEQAVRTAHGCLRLTIDPWLEVLNQ
ncbi:MAG: ATP-grasp domain-containing protein [Acidobacteria bacterium]|nr:ATP-grasp domain-containing protein [Acidobacteriota bacterium]MSO83753.1 ATP-grasp domain-containing protein [Acidobacteriota bacterium]